MTLAQYAMMLIIGWQTYNIARDGGHGCRRGLGTVGPYRAAAIRAALPAYALLGLGGVTISIGVTSRAYSLGSAWLRCHAGTGSTTSNNLTLPTLFSVAVVLGIVRAFNGPALSALAP